MRLAATGVIACTVLSVTVFHVGMLAGNRGEYSQGRRLLGGAMALAAIGALGALGILMRECARGA